MLEKWNKLKAKAFKKRWHFLALAATLALCTVGLWSLMGNLYDTNRYTNMTDREAGEQVTRMFSERAQACRDVGGAWYAGFVDSGCTVAYQAPDFDWFLRPTSNPQYQPNHSWGSFSAALSIVFACFTILALMMWIFKYNEDLYDPL